jgi:hypothetical protein
MTMSQYLGRGATSRGRMTITPALSTVVSTLPYLRDTNDVKAVIQGIKNLQAALANVPSLNWTYPPVGTTVEDFVNDVSRRHLLTFGFLLTTQRCSYRTRIEEQTTGLVNSTPILLYRS